MKIRLEWFYKNNKNLLKKQNKLYKEYKKNSYMDDDNAKQETPVKTF